MALRQHEVIDHFISSRGRAGVAHCGSAHSENGELWTKPDGISGHMVGQWDGDFVFVFHPDLPLAKKLKRSIEERDLNWIEFEEGMDR